MKYSKKNIDDVEMEEAHGGSGFRQVIVKPEDLTTKNFEAMTKGYLKTGKAYDWHEHLDTDEFFLVLKGEGKFYWVDEVTNYIEGDIITIPANTRHKIEAEKDSEYYFIRIKC